MTKRKRKPAREPFHVDLDALLARRDNPRMILSASDIARIYGVPRELVRRWAIDGTLPAPPKRGRTLRWDQHVVEEVLLKKRRLPRGKKPPE